MEPPMVGEKIKAPCVKRFCTWRPGQYLRSSARLLTWMLLRAGGQAALIVLVARAIGADDYGQLVAALAIAALVTPFAGLGLSGMLLRNAAKDPDNSLVYLRRALRIWVASTAVCIALVWPLTRSLLPDGVTWLPACIAIAVEIAVSSLTEIAARYQQSQHRINAYGAANAGPVAARLLAVGSLLALDPMPDLQGVFWTHAAGGLVYCLWLWRRLSGTLRGGDAPEPMTATSGVPFALGALAMRLQAEFNKPVLAHLGFGIAGNFNAAQRATDLVSMPLLALQEALWPRLYAQRDPSRRLRQTGVFLAALALLWGGGLWLAAPLLPKLLGEDFSDAVAVMRALAWLPVLQLLRSLFNFSIIHAGTTRLLGWANGLGAIVSVVSVAGLVPILGATGAIVACYAAELSMIAILGTGLRLRDK
ncbi:MAG TPA: hypothetical protein VGD42_15895 [Lysobacter sp.]